MAFRIGNNVIRGEIDNRFRGRVVGRIWVQGLDEPIRLDLHGNCLRDIAGQRLTFHTTKPPDALTPEDRLHQDQEGSVGDMTASRKVKTFDMSVEAFIAKRRAHIDVPTRMANCLYLEWFSQRNGRVVIETVDFEIDELSEPAWVMTAKEEREQCRLNLNAMTDFMARLDDAVAAAEDTPEDEPPFDEFAWERFLRDADERTDRLGKILEKYADHPDAEKLMAREMGWDWMDDALDADDRGLLDHDHEALHDEQESFPDPEPDPQTEGVDWIRTRDGRIRHPLADRAFEFQHRLWSEARERNLVGSDDSDEDVMNMISEARMLSAKLAGALNRLAYDHHGDPGFIVAYLKRALSYFDTTLAAMGSVQEKELLDEPVLHVFRCELFEIREGILRLMKFFRAQI